MFYENLFQKKRQLESDNIYLKLTNLDIRELTEEEKESKKGSIIENEALNFFENYEK